MGDDGLSNQATFNNNTGGDIQIDRATSGGLYNLATFTNAASITIGAIAPVGWVGLLNQATFTNNTGGVIQIDRSTNYGLYSFGNPTPGTQIANVHQRGQHYNRG